MSESKKAKAAAEAVRPLSEGNVGETLKAGRMARGLELEGVSATIHIRAAQLRAIEEGDIAALPGMTYAVGFVRSYANFLGLNGTEIVHKFKAEHGHSPAPTQLAFPEPVAESRMPDPIMIGIGAFLAIVVLVGWTFWSNMHSNSVAQNEIQSAPVEETVDAAPAEETAPPAEETATAAEQPATIATPATEVTPAPAAVTETKPVEAVATTPEQAEAKTDAAKTETSKSEATKPSDISVDEKQTEKTAVKEETEDQAPKKEEKTAKADEDEEQPVVIKKGKTRVTLKATQATWIQITDGNNVVYKKVLKSGETYSVPDQPGLSLVTANAGGLDVVVDGQKVQSLGKSGEIVRGVSLDAGALKNRKKSTPKYNN